MTITSKLVDKVVEKTTGFKTNYISEDEMVVLFSNIYLSQITDKNEFSEIMSFIEPSAFKGSGQVKYSIDGRYEIKSRTQLRSTFPTILHWFWVTDRVENVCYEYSAVLWGGFKNKVQAEVEKYSGISGGVGMGLPQQQTIVPQQQMSVSQQQMNLQPQQKMMPQQQNYDQFRFCTQCGNKIELESVFCCYCGHQLGTTSVLKQESPRNERIKGPYVIQSKDTDLKKGGDVSFDQTPLNGIDFFSGDITSYIQYRDLELNGIIPVYSKMKNSQYYKNRVNDMLMITLLHTRILRDSGLFERIPQLPFEMFTSYIGFDVENYRHMALNNVFLNGILLQQTNGVDLKCVDKLYQMTRNYPATILLYYNTEFFKLSGVAVTERYLYFPESNTYMPHSKLFNIELVKQSNRYELVFKSEQFNIVIAGLKINEKGLIGGLIDGLNYYEGNCKGNIEEDSNLYFINLVKTIIMRYGGNQVLKY